MTSGTRNKNRNSKPEIRNLNVELMLDWPSGQKMHERIHSVIGNLVIDSALGFGIWISGWIAMLRRTFVTSRSTPPAPRFSRLMFLNIQFPRCKNGVWEFLCNKVCCNPGSFVIGAGGLLI